MHSIKKKSLAVAAAAVMGVTGIAGVGMASAASNSADPSHSLVDKIATTFNLDKSKVEAVFEEDRKQHAAEHQAKLEERLAQAVSDGKLTQAQKDAILEKLKSFKAKIKADFEASKDKTHAERKTVMKERRAELKQWAEDNNIPTEYLRFIVGEKRMHHHEMDGHPTKSDEQS